MDVMFVDLFWYLASSAGVVVLVFGFALGAVFVMVVGNWKCIPPFTHTNVCPKPQKSPKTQPPYNKRE